MARSLQPFTPTLHTMKLDELNILDIGNTIQIAGVIYAGRVKGEDMALLCNFPDDVAGRPGRVEYLDMDSEDWKRFLRQTDLLETEVLQRAADGSLTKAILRKCQRQIDALLSWKVFRRDNFACRYCGKPGGDVVLTVDHIITWESGGPTIEENLLTACKKCNKVRGDTPYERWLEHPYYKDVSQGLSALFRSDNQAILAELDAIPKVAHVRSR